MTKNIMDTDFEELFSKAIVLEQTNEEYRRSSLPDAYIHVSPVQPRKARRTLSCKAPRRRSVSPRPLRFQQLSNPRVENNNEHSPLHRASLVFLPPPSPALKPSSLGNRFRSASWKSRVRPSKAPLTRSRSRSESSERTQRMKCSNEEVHEKLQQLKRLQAVEVRPVRNFTTHSSGALINRGDSFKRKKRSSTLADTSAHAAATAAAEDFQKTYRCLLIGSPAVGKTALMQQFMTSEYMCAQATSFDEDCETTISVLLDGEETALSITDVNFGQDFRLYPTPDAFIVVFSITEKYSFDVAAKTLKRIRQDSSTKYLSVILVGNKSDLERGREISSEVDNQCDLVVGRTLALQHGAKYTEVSAALNHRVDNLLVGIVVQVHMNPMRDCSDEDKKRLCLPILSRKGFLGKLLNRTTEDSVHDCERLNTL